MKTFITSILTFIILMGLMFLLGWCLKYAIESEEQRISNTDKCLAMVTKAYKHRKYTGSYEMLTNGLHCLDTNGSLHPYKQTTGE